MITRRKIRSLIIHKSAGNITDLLTMGLIVIAMATVLISFMDFMKLIGIREDVSQISRRYMLITETEGYLPAEDKSNLENELADAGLTDIDLSGTTFSKAGYGSVILLEIKGKVDGKYEIKESRSSTAKY